jgi:hypothetical protein
MATTMLCGAADLDGLGGIHDDTSSLIPDGATGMCDDHVGRKIGQSSRAKTRA